MISAECLLGPTRGVHVGVKDTDRMRCPRRPISHRREHHGGVISVSNLLIFLSHRCLGCRCVLGHCFLLIVVIALVLLDPALAVV